MEESEQKAAAAEECRSSVQQEASALRSSLRELERSRLQARRQLQELRRQVRLCRLLPSHHHEIQGQLIDVSFLNVSR